MARFDVYRIARTGGYLLDIQTDFLGYLNTRVVVPLLPPLEAPMPARRLNPSFQVETKDVVMVTQFVAALSKSELGEHAGNLSHYRDEIVGAIDFLMQRF